MTPHATSTDERILLLRHIAAVKNEARATADYLASLRSRYRAMVLAAIGAGGDHR